MAAALAEVAASAIPASAARGMVAFVMRFILMVLFWFCFRSGRVNSRPNRGFVVRLESCPLLGMRTRALCAQNLSSLRTAMNPGTVQERGYWRPRTVRINAHDLYWSRERGECFRKLHPLLPSRQAPRDAGVRKAIS